VASPVLIKGVFLATPIAALANGASGRVIGRISLDQYFIKEKSINKNHLKIII
jgi:hypothetical protein